MAFLDFSFESGSVFALSNSFLEISENWFIDVSDPAADNAGDGLLVME